MENGTVKFFNKDKGFGFIETSTGDLFFHISQRSPQEQELPADSATIYFMRGQGRKGSEAKSWQLSQALSTSDRVEKDAIDPEQDRRDGYRPGIMVALRCGNEYLLGRRRGSWTWLLSAIDQKPHDAKGWMFSWGVPQGGIEEGETCEDAIRRELSEELGDYTTEGSFEKFTARMSTQPMGTMGWCDYIVGEPKFLFKERSTFRVEKDGKVYKGKTLYAFVVDISGLPEEAFDWMYGHRQDEFWTLPCPEFEGGVQFYSPDTCVEMIEESQKGPKGAQLTRLINEAKAA